MSFGLPVRNGLAVGLLASTFLSSLRIGGRPAMFLDFIGTNSLDSRVTFTRATTATFVGSNGLIQTAAINAPRFDYDPATLAPKGILIEEQRTNLALQSALASGWTLSTVTRTVNATNAPDGTLTANLYSATGADSSVSQLGIAVSASTAYTFSIYLRADVATTVTIFIVDSGGGSGNTGAVCNVTTQWQRFTVTRTTSVGTTSCTVQVGGGSTFSTGEAVYVWGAQLEAGAFATSYIPTVASTVTRSADVATMTGTNFSSWYNASEGTIVAQSSNFSKANFPVVVAINDGTLPNRIVTLSSTTTQNRLSVVTGNVNQAEFPFSNYVTGTIVSQALAIKANDFAGSVNGATVQTDTSGTVPTVTQMQLGVQAGGLNPLNGHIRQIAYYNTRLSNATLQALTA